MGLGRKDEGIKKYKLAVMKQSWDVKYGTGNIANNTVIIRYGTRRVLEISTQGGGHFVEYIIV